MRPIFALILWSFCLFAQDTAQITGLVSDPQRAAVPNVAVTITRIDTGAESRTSSTASGRYGFSALQPGKYRLQLSKDGFQTAVANDVELHVADRQEFSFNLVLGSVSENVTVNGSTPLLDTTDGAVSTVVDREFVENLPLSGRTFQNLIAITPGVVATATGGGQAGQFSVNGMRADSNYFSVDGVSANFGLPGSGLLYQGAGGQLPALSTMGGTNSLVSIEAMEEFRIQTSSFAPEFGRQPGGQVGIVTRGGTNQFHASLFEYFRNDALNANDWFANAAGLPRAKERQNDFGGVFGGPVGEKQDLLLFLLRRAAGPPAANRQWCRALSGHPRCGSGVPTALPGGVFASHRPRAARRFRAFYRDRFQPVIARCLQHSRRSAPREPLLPFRPLQSIALEYLAAEQLGGKGECE